MAELGMKQVMADNEDTSVAFPYGVLRLILVGRNHLLLLVEKGKFNIQLYLHITWIIRGRW